MGEPSPFVERIGGRQAPVDELDEEFGREDEAGVQGRVKDGADEVTV